VISDAAVEISEGVLRGIGTHPVIAEAVLESDEVLTRSVVSPGSDLDGVTIGERRIKPETGMRVIAVRRARSDEGAPTDDRLLSGESEGNEANKGGGENGRSVRNEWVISPGPETELHAGDVLIAKGTRAGAQRLDALAGDGSGEDD
jgi:uncharacterized protein with PhoU and TrkA domain